VAFAQSRSICRIHPAFLTHKSLWTSRITALTDGLTIA
jgi:hypothetical protein